ncbi:efflux RND transporter permease subunit [Devosia submarina]|uniref:efflux RND transporter permease subunit n=1 Tax=Devosia submarina TaxID=1173082 RepID=UPI000D3C7D2C|nr:efflux RND transporter permease subunit [Devosia submarina]
MKTFNLSEWALDHKSLVWFFMIVCTVAGISAYMNLGREEDPNFTIKTMVIAAQWPGASVEEMTNQVTDRIEQKLVELSQLDYTTSTTTAGQTVVNVNLDASVAGGEVTATWTQVRNLIGDIAGEFPPGVIGPFFNDRFGDVYGNIYAFTADGLTDRQLRDYVEDVREQVLRVPNVGRVDLLGVQDEVIFLEFSPQKLSAYGVSQQSIIGALQAQNAVTQTGVIQAGAERVAIRVGGGFTSQDSIRDINLRVGETFFRLADVATITRGYEDPPSPMFRYNGEPVIGLAVGMVAGSNLLVFGEALTETIDHAVANLPIGIDLHKVSDQPEVVEHSVDHFVRSLMEAIAIVLAVSFVSLGMRAGFVVALAIPLVLAITFFIMQYFGISLQRISLGALIIALGLLVDDAMIAVEMMVSRLEAGDTLRKAATAVYTSTAFPMLTGTLVTVASFIPVGLNGSAAGEYTFSLFVVIAVSLVVSWVVAVVFTPLLGVLILPKKMKHKSEEPGRLTRTFSAVLKFCMRARWLTIGVCVAALAVSIYLMGSVQQQFFPASDRAELVVDFNLPQDATILETKAQMDRFEKEQLAGNADIEHWSSYVGQGATRFLLSFDPTPANPYVGQIIIVTKDLEARNRIRPKLQSWLKEAFPGTDAFVKLLDIGPPVGRPVQYRVSGPDVEMVRSLANELASAIGHNQQLGDITFDWNEPSRVIKVDVLQDNAAQLGITSQDIAYALNGIVGGSTITQVRDETYLVPIIARATADERSSVEALRNIRITNASGNSVPLASVATFRFQLEQPVIQRRAGVPTITLKATVLGSVQPATVVANLTPTVDEFISKLPAGYAVEIGGSVESSAEGQGPIVAVVPLMLIAMATLLMIQLQSFQRLFIVFAVAPLGLIGVVAALLLSGAPMGFVAILGVLALVGILIRNSVILVVQIEDLLKTGMNAWHAVVEATEHRMRPIILTAAAASLALIPISREVFWGPMAYAMMGGIIVGTVLTLLFLPALYVAWFRIKEPVEGDLAEMEAVNA